MKNKKWIIKENIPLEKTAKNLHLNSLVLQLLADRGLRTDHDIREFLSPEYPGDVHDPFLFLDMRTAVETINRIIFEEKRITIHGDYDADGVCAALILFEALKKMEAKVDVYLPHREKEGYGLTELSVSKIAAKGTGLLITVDCGVSNIEEVNKAKELGMEVIVTDHHKLPECLPDCPIIHPRLKGQNYPYAQLAGGGVAFKLVQALVADRKKSDNTTKGRSWEVLEKWLLDLVAVATVADLMPLTGENRTLVKYGLIVLSKTRRKGMRYLLEQAGLWNKNELRSPKLTAYNIGFQIAPRINAAGRMAHAQTSFDLLSSQDDCQALGFAKELENNNTQRKQLVEKTMKQAREQLGAVDTDKVQTLFAYDPDWSLGVAGLVAGRLAQEYNLPVVIATDMPDRRIVGSVRSVYGFDFVGALDSVKNLFQKYGGHSMACGFALKERGLWKEFQEKINLYMRHKIILDDLVPVLEIDMQIPLKKFDWEMVNSMEGLEPFGNGNSKPIFLTEGVFVEQINTVGAGNNHLRLSVVDKEGLLRKGIGFGFGQLCNMIKKGDKIDMVYEVDINEWKGRRDLQFSLVDLRLSE